MSHKNILIATPIRNRAWIIENYLSHLEILDYPANKIAFHFIVNDNEDSLWDKLYPWRFKSVSRYRYIRFSEVRFGCPTDMGESGNGRVPSRKLGKPRRDLYTYPALSALRNLILAAARLDKKADYLFSIDSDILVKPDILNKLINTQKDIVAALCETGMNKKTGVLNYNFVPWEGFSKRHILPEGVMEVKTTGAVMLVSRKVFSNEKIIYYSASSGEDEGFCESARAQGIKSYILPEMQTHIMNKEMISCAR